MECDIIRLKFNKYLKELTESDDHQSYFSLHQCHECGRWVRYIYGDIYCYECFNTIMLHKNREDIPQKAKYYYDGEIIGIDGMKFGYK